MEVDLEVDQEADEESDLESELEVEVEGDVEVDIGSQMFKALQYFVSCPVHLVLRENIKRCFGRCPPPYSC